MQATQITITKDENGKMVIRHRNGDYTLDDDTRKALAALIDDSEWQEY